MHSLHYKIKEVFEFIRIEKPHICDQCSTSLPLRKKRFCNDGCRLRWYYERTIYKKVNEAIINDSIASLDHTVGLLIKLGYTVMILRNERK